MRVFVSYHSPDHEAAQDLQAQLAQKSSALEVFFAPYNLSLGAFWLPQLSAEIEEADAFVILIGDILGEWQKLEYYEALEKHLKYKRSGRSFPLIPVLISETPPNLPFLSQLHRIEAPAADDPLLISRVFDALQGREEAEPDALWRSVNPYRGLFALEEQDADFFFGREQETREIIEKIISSSGRVVGLVGNSGVGKSSLVQAGVIASLKRQALPQGDDWPDTWPNSRAWSFITFRPGENPIKALAAAYTARWSLDPSSAERFEETDKWAQRLKNGAPLTELAEAAEAFYLARGGSAPQRTLVYIDQGEELYARCDPATAARFSQIVAEAAQSPKFAIIFSQRSDYYGHLQENEALWRVVDVVDVPPLKEASLKEVLRRPAEALGAEFEDPSIPEILAASGHRQAGALPLLAD